MSAPNPVFGRFEWVLLSALAFVGVFIVLGELGAFRKSPKETVIGNPTVTNWVTVTNVVQNETAALIIESLRSRVEHCQKERELWEKAAWAMLEMNQRITTNK